MKPFYGFIKNFLIIVTGFIFVTIAISYLLFSNNEQSYSVNPTEVPQFVCGNVSLYPTCDVIDGRNLFNANCAACHKLDKKATGPALRSIATKEFPDENYLSQFILDENLLKGASKVYSDKMNQKYRSDFQHKFNLSESDLDALKEYLK